jgi:hypothetical protein
MSAATEVLARLSLSEVSRTTALIPLAPKELDTSLDTAVRPLESGAPVNTSHSEHRRVSIATLRCRLAKAIMLASEPDESAIPTTRWGKDARGNGIPVNCAYAMFEDSVFRQEVADGAWSILRLAIPSLVPWKWNMGIWSVNQRKAIEDLSECIICPNSRGQYPSAIEHNRATKQLMTLRFECPGCDGAIHTSNKVSISAYVAFGTGRLTKAQWLQILTSSFPPLIPCSIG